MNGTPDNDAPIPSGIGLIDHLERYLGLIQGGWSKTFKGEKAPFQVVQCGEGMMEDVDAFATLGLSHYPLASSVSEQIIRHELFFIFRSGQDYGGIADLLQQVGSEALQRNSAYLRGEVIGPRAPLFKGSLLEALYVAIPVYYPDEFAVYENPDGDAIVMAWLIPITHAEAHYVFDKGWSAFEELLVEQDPDLLDICRPSVV